MGVNFCDYLFALLFTRETLLKSTLCVVQINLSVLIAMNKSAYIAVSLVSFYAPVTKKKEVI